MVKNSFSDAALVLVGHGSTKNADSSAPVYQHAAELTRRKIFGRVLEGFWKVEPRIGEVMRGIVAPQVFIVPLFISEGYFTQQAIPLELGLRAPNTPEFARSQRRGEQMLYYCPPVGTHPTMTDVLLARARDVVKKHPFPRAHRPDEIALFVVGHGTSENENSRVAIEQHVRRVRERGEYAEVHSVFIEEEPRVAECYRMTQAQSLVVVPFFISDGLHSREDIPALLGEPREKVQARLKSGQPTWRNPTERNGKRVWYSTSVGTEPTVAEVILARVEECLRVSR